MSKSHVYRSEPDRELFALNNIRLQMDILNPKHVPSHKRQRAERVFEFWHYHWSKAFSEIGKEFSVNSDEFSRHSAVVVLLNGEEPIACVLLDQFDLHYAVNLKNSHFNNFPREVVQEIKLLSCGRPIMTVGYLTVHEYFRGQKGIVDTVLGLAIQTFFAQSSCEILVTYTRNTRRTNELTYRLGAQPIVKNITVNSEPSDFVYFNKNNRAHLTTNFMKQVIEKIWHNYINKGVNMNENTVFNKMVEAIDEIDVAARNFDWLSEAQYANWLAQSFFYVQWTTRQLALASAYTKPMQEDSLHWRFIEEAKEEKKHELLAFSDLKNLGYSPNQFAELPHTSFFYQTLSYLIANEHPAAILGYSLTLEGFAAKKLPSLYPKIVAKYGEKCSSFLRLHCELDKDHFDNALPHLKSCPDHLYPLIYKSINQCAAIYKGILADISAANTTKKVSIQNAGTSISLPT